MPVQHLRALEDQSVYILREAYKHFDSPLAARLARPNTSASPAGGSIAGKNPKAHIPERHCTSRQQPVHRHTHLHPMPLLPFSLLSLVKSSSGHFSDRAVCLCAASLQFQSGPAIA